MISVKSQSRLRSKDYENPFTELFSYFRRSDGSVSCLKKSFNAEDLKDLYQHILNANEGLVLGLEDLGTLLCYMAQTNLKGSSIANLGHFVCIISNLMDALNLLQLDTEYVMREQHIYDY